VVLVALFFSYSVFLRKIFASVDEGIFTFDFTPASNTAYISSQYQEYYDASFYSRIRYDDGLDYPLGFSSGAVVNSSSNQSFNFILDCGNGTRFDQGTITFPRSGSYTLKFTGCQYKERKIYNPVLVVSKMIDGVAVMGYTAKTEISIFNDPTNYWLAYNNCTLPPVAKEVTPSAEEISTFGSQVKALEYNISGYEKYLMGGNTMRIAYSLSEISKVGSGGYLELKASITNKTSSDIRISKFLAKWEERQKPFDLEVIPTLVTLAPNESRIAKAKIYPNSPVENYQYAYLVKFLIGYDFPKPISDWLCQIQPINLANIVPVISPVPTTTTTSTVGVLPATPQPTPSFHHYMQTGFNVIGVTEDTNTAVFLQNGMTFFAFNSNEKKWDVTSQGSVDMKANVAYYAYSNDNRWIALPKVNYYNLTKPVNPGWNLLWMVGEPKQDLKTTLYDESGTCLAKDVPLDYLKQKGVIYKWIFIIQDSQAVDPCSAFALLTDQNKPAVCQDQMILAETTTIPAMKGMWLYFYKDRFRQSDFNQYWCN